MRKAGARTVDVEVDGSPWRRLPVEVAVNCRLEPGRGLDRARLRLLRDELRRVEAMSAATRSLRHRDLSAIRLDAELAQRRIAPAERRRALKTLERAGLVDDRRVGAARAASLARRGYGNEAIRWRLEEEGFPDEVAEEAIAMLEPERQRAARLVEREGESARTLRSLARRGFGEDVIEASLGRAKGER